MSEYKGMPPPPMDPGYYYKKSLSFSVLKASALFMDMIDRSEGPEAQRGIPKWQPTILSPSLFPRLAPRAAVYTDIINAIKLS